MSVDEVRICDALPAEARSFPGYAKCSNPSPPQYHSPRTLAKSGFVVTTGLPILSALSKEVDQISPAHLVRTGGQMVIGGHEGKHGIVHSIVSQESLFTLPKTP